MIERSSTVEAARHAIDEVFVLVGTEPGARRALVEYLAEAGVTGRSGPALVEGTLEELLRDALGRLVGALDQDPVCAFEDLKARAIGHELLVLLPG